MNVEEIVNKRMQGLEIKNMILSWIYTIRLKVLLKYMWNLSQLYDLRNYCFMRLDENTVLTEYRDGTHR
jgi:hypothetical protein